MEPDGAAGVSTYPHNETLHSAKNAPSAGLTKFVRKLSPCLLP